MANRIPSGALSLAISLLSLNVGPVEAKNRANLELAAAFQLPELPKLPSLSGASADWRQFVKKGKSVIPLASASGDLGLMQVNRNTWRNLYDLKRLGGDIEYNGNAGGEILVYYLTRHAIRKNEHKQQGGNLARATYAAYNGGPSHLARQRKPGAQESRRRFLRQVSSGELRSRARSAALLPKIGGDRI
jgi:hypothetical protein